MKQALMLALTILAFAVASPVAAQSVGPVPNGCYKDLSGVISCPPMGGDIVVTLSGQAVCGKGHCVRNVFGKVTCSSLPGGQATQDIYGTAMCVGDCEEASPAYCQQLR